MEQEVNQVNPLGKEPVGKLMLKFAIPAIISMLVGSLYNIVDQIFIGQGVGVLGNAATNVAFPIATVCTAVALLLGIGGASGYNLESGRGDEKKATHIVGSSLTSLFIIGVVVMIIVLIFCEPLMKAFGASESVLPYANDYTIVTAYGIPFLVLQIGGGHLIRADRSPTVSMICMLTGAILNTIMDPIFIFGFGWGIKGGAWATTISQVVAGLMVVAYFLGAGKLRNMKLKMKMLIPSGWCIKIATSLGLAAFINQIAMAVVQVVLNNILSHYGALSHYGPDIPLACVGVVSKLGMVFMAICIGIAQGSQPIWGFNYGAQKYARVRKTYLLAFRAVLIVGVVFFAIFQLFPRQLVRLFGEGSEEYFTFSMKYLRVYMLMTFANGIQPLSSQFFTSIGKASRGAFMSLTRQVLFLLPLIILLPSFFGIEGVIFAGPVADAAALVIALVFARGQFKDMHEREKNVKVEA
jgi:Na+-driven multidrug efflux pump